MRSSLTILAACLPLAGCVAQAAPYRFGSPMLGGARLADVTAPDSPQHTRHDVDETRPEQPPASANLAAVPAALITTEWLAPPEPNVDGEPAAATETATGIVWSRLPAPHRALVGDALSSLASVDSAASLRALTGIREPAAPLDWAFAAALRVAHSGDLPNPATGADLLTWATGDSRLIAVDKSLVQEVVPGDLLVFDRALAGAPASLVAVVIGHDERGVIEMMYLGGGLIRRGFLDPTRPSIRRDADGAVVNTYLRHNRDWPPPGTKFLAGELLAAAVRITPR